jgi:hypothetical protein
MRLAITLLLFSVAIVGCSTPKTVEESSTILATVPPLRGEEETLSVAERYRSGQLATEAWAAFWAPYMWFCFVVLRQSP